MSGSFNTTPVDFEYHSILPPSVNIDRRMLLLEKLFAERLQALDLSVLLVNLVDHVENSALIWLAKQFSLFGDGWELATSEQAQREIIKTAIDIHRHKGTPWAIKQALQVLGFGDAVLIEHSGYAWHDGTIRHNRQAIYRSTHWWEYDLKLSRPITREQGANIRLALIEIAPARAVLKRINIRGSLRHDSKIRHNAVYGYGVIGFNEADF